MSTLRLEKIADVHLSVIVDAAANLTAQLSELNELREMVRKAELSAQEHTHLEKKDRQLRRPLSIPAKRDLSPRYPVSSAVQRVVSNEGVALTHQPASKSTLPERNSLTVQ
jgi:hypothetical protein